jgi:hypothetical protein
MKYAILAVLLLAPLGLRAQGPVGSILPDNPKPKTDRTLEFKLQVAGMTASWAADFATTRRAFEQCPNCTEQGGLFNGSRNTLKIMGAWALVDAGCAIGALEWKRHVGNRYLHPLWRVPMLTRMALHANGAYQGAQF